MYFNVKEKAVCTGTIPALLIEPATIKKDIVLIYYHGWGSSVTSSRFRASIWAAAGYPVLIVEESLHDSRGSYDYDRDMNKLPQVLLQNIEEYEVVAKYLDEDFPGFKRIVCGHSLGGFTAMGLLSKGDVMGVMALNGMGDWQAMAKGPYKEKIEELNPIRHVEDHVEKAILMLNGEADQSVNPVYQKNYYEAIRPLHKKTKPLVYECMEMTSHVVTTNMMELSLAFLEEL